MPGAHEKDISLRSGVTAPQRGTTVVLEVSNLRVEAPSGHPILEDVSFSLRAGEVLGLVGESGSGKTTTALSLLGYTQAGARITSGQISIGGARVEATVDRAARRLRGRLISYVPQNPGTALNPSMRIGDAIAAMVQAHHRAGASPSIGSALAAVNLPDGREFQRRYPHQLSGGQQQRVCIAVAVVCEPPVVVFDEPTTGLDVVTQSLILDELLRLRREHDISMLYVAHDLAVVAQVATRIAVMYAGRIVEEGPAKQILRRPRHPYTRGLLASIPDHVRPRTLQPMLGVAVGIGERPQGCSFAPRCPMRIDVCEQAVPELRPVGHAQLARCLRAEEVAAPEQRPLVLRSAAPHESAAALTVSNLRAEHRGRRETIVAAEDVSFEIGRGRCVALVGESGSGKTTIARTIVGLHPIAAGEIRLGGEILAEHARHRSREQRRRVQIIFQNPGDALNPRQTVGAAIARPARVLRRLNAGEAGVEVKRLLELVRLPQRLSDRYPTELSGGERQRVGIARALAANPDVVVCDEITSALDVSVQAAVLELLGDLCDKLELALLFITHDLGVVATVADHVLVLDGGHVCEAGATQAILQSPKHAYTRRLLAAAPSISHILEHP
jgi:peptide/nickel transport system ATP-binding protein